MKFVWSCRFLLFGLVLIVTCNARVLNNFTQPSLEENLDLTPIFLSKRSTWFTPPGFNTPFQMNPADSFSNQMFTAPPSSTMMLPSQLAPAPPAFYQSQASAYDNPNYQSGMAPVYLDYQAYPTSISISMDQSMSNPQVQVKEESSHQQPPAYMDSANQHSSYKPVSHEPPPYVAPTYEPPSYQQSTYEPPAYEPPAFEPPKYEPPKYEPPAYAEPAYEPPAYEPTKYEPTKYEKPTYQQSSYGPAKYEPPKYEPPKYEPPKYEPPKYQPPKYQPSTYESTTYRYPVTYQHKPVRPHKPSSYYRPVTHKIRITKPYRKRGPLRRGYGRRYRH